MSQTAPLAPEQQSIPEQELHQEAQVLVDGADAQTLAFPEVEATQGQWNEFHAPNDVSRDRQQFGQQFDKSKNLDSEIRNARHADGTFGLPQKPENTSTEFAVMGKRLETAEETESKRALEALDTYMKKVDGLADAERPQIFAQGELAKNAGRVVMQRTTRVR